MRINFCFVAFQVQHLNDLTPVCLLQLPKEERQGIPHHLIDILTPGEDFSAGSFHNLARQATAEILQVQEDGARQDATFHAVAPAPLLQVRLSAWTMGGFSCAARTHSDYSWREWLLSAMVHLWQAHDPCVHGNYFGSCTKSPRQGVPMPPHGGGNEGSWWHSIRRSLSEVFHAGLGRCSTRAGRH